MRFSVFPFIVRCSFAIAVAQAEDEVDRLMQAMVDWIGSTKNGFVSDKVEVRRRDPSDPNSRFGMFATEDIQSKERIMHVPIECTIEMDYDYQTDHFIDDLILLADEVDEEMGLGEQSEFAPFVNFLNTQPNNVLPAMWSNEAQDLLELIIGNGYELGKFGWKQPILGPLEVFGLHGVKCSDEGHAKERCMDPPMYYAVARVLQHANFNVLTPMTDMIYHNTGATNTYNTPLYSPNGYTVSASKSINAGEEIFTSYNKNLSNSRKTAGTAEVLRDYGFVETYPRRWTFFKLKIGFDLKKVQLANGETALKLKWIRKPTSEEQIYMLDHEYQRLSDLLKYEIKDAQGEGIIPENEMNTIIEFHEALLEALLLVGREAAKIDDICRGDSCDVTSNAADVATAQLDDFYQKFYQCETLSRNVYIYTELETQVSQYQDLDYREHPDSKNCCFYLDEIFQICESYWPHYHEMFVHKPAKYIAGDVKRLLWVGGGDSGLVNEIVKYPNLELAVGLELDQKVTRGAFKFFGAQPHFDNEKVQWWFGDASKSLLMLPVEYFGSFDMVMVDLSDTVLAFSVSKTLDIFSALSLLLKPEGLLVMNELFFKRVSDVFEYTINLSFTGVPEIEDQHYVIGSNGVDFLKRQLVEHDLGDSVLHVENSVYKTKHQFDMVHDYRHNNDNAFKKLCKKDGEDDDETDTQEASPGILMIIEAENVSADLKSIGDVQTSVVTALEEVGLNLIKATSLSPSESADDEEATNFVFILQQGYAIVRTFPEYKHCSFDIHLWSEFSKHEAAKKALIASVGGSMDSVTSYRIVAGGMFGVSTWKDDEKSRGPKITQICKDSSSSGALKKNTESISTALKAGVSLIQEQNARVLVACGYKTDSCDSVELLKKEGRVGEVLPVYTCPGLVAGGEQSFDKRQEIISNCKDALIQSLNDTFSGNERELHAIVLDSGLPREMESVLSQILFATFRGQKVAPRDVFSDRLLVFGTVEDESQDWRRAFFNTVREKIIIADPIFYSRVFFNNSDSSVELHVTSSGDERFIEQLASLVSSVEKDTGLTLDVRNILGGYWKPEVKDVMEPWEASKYMSPSDYDHTSALKQWKSQQPLGYQTVFQLEQGKRFKVGDFVMANYKTMSREMKAEVIWVDGINDFYTIRFLANDEEDTTPGSRLRLSGGGKKESSSPPTKINATQIDDAFKTTISTVEKGMSTADVHHIDTIGDGYILTALWSGGTVVLVWDGRSHIDINFFTYEERRELADEFIFRFKRAQGTLTTSLRDEQPRGRGNVVNFLADIQSGEPRWA